MTTTPDTIVLVHGLWVTPRSWEHWVARYEAKGFKTIAPGYPGFKIEVEAINADPSIDAWVDYKNDSRAPLLFISAGEDHIMPPSVQKSNAKHYAGKTA